MKFSEIFAVTLFAAGAIARPQDTGDDGGVEALHGWCQCVVRGLSPALPAGDQTIKACREWQDQSGLSASYDPINVRCNSIGSRIPGAAFQKLCAEDGKHDSKCS